MMGLTDDMASWARFSNSFYRKELNRFWTAVDCVTNDVVGTIRVEGQRSVGGKLVRQGDGWTVQWQVNHKQSDRKKEFVLMEIKVRIVKKATSNLQLDLPWSAIDCFMSYHASHY